LTPQAAKSGVMQPFVFKGLDSRHLIPACYEYVYACGLHDHDPFRLLSSAREGGTTTTADGMGSNASGVAKQIRRLDIPLPLDWIEKHIDDLRKLIYDVSMRMVTAMQWISEGKLHRASRFKKDALLQSFPTNCQASILKGQYRGSASGGANGDGESMVVAEISCGCFSAHGMGYKKGVYDMVKYNRDVEVQIDLVLGSLEDALDDRSGALKIEAPPVSALMDDTSHKLYSDRIGTMLKMVLDLEERRVATAARASATSAQMISVVVNGIFLKLSLVASGRVSHDIALRWKNDGMLIVFESLLSTRAAELCMVNDVVASVEMAKEYKFRIHATRDKEPGVEMVGQEVKLLIPLDELARLPQEIRDEALTDKGCPIRVLPVLFSQGLDIMQSMANNFAGKGSSEASGGVDVQVRYR